MFLFLHLTLAGPELGMQRQLAPPCPPRAPGALASCAGHADLGAAFPQRCWRTGPSPTSYWGNAASDGDTHSLLSAVQGSQSCFCDILNSALCTAVTRPVPQPAFPNTSVLQMQRLLSGVKG